MLGAENTPDFGKYLENLQKFEKRLVFFEENIKKRLGTFRKDFYKFSNFVQFNVINHIRRHFFWAKNTTQQNSIRGKNDPNLPEKEGCGAPQTFSFDKTNN